MSDSEIKLPRGITLDEVTDDDLQKIGEQLGVVESLPEKPKRTEFDRLKDFFFRKNEHKFGPKCGCGAFLIDGAKHSDYCARYGRDD